MQTEQITLDVPADVARRFREATPEQQERVKDALARIVARREEQIRELERAMDAMARTAQARGLTEEKLEALLGESSRD